MKKIILCLAWLLPALSGSGFVHPGMLQDRAGLEYMKTQVHAGLEPWKTAFENLKRETSLDFQPKAFTHVSVGPYGANDHGSRDFELCGKAAFNHALMGYLTGNQANYDKAIEIINAWSYRLWDFDANNAKLTVGLFAPYFLNAAEIVKHCGNGWAEKDQKQFNQLIFTVLYPTIHDFFKEANGNWDASMIYTMLCMGVFLDNQPMFDRATERFYRGEGNSGITKYIYPTGQCQETTRDWDHVQLGLGELAKAAQVAFTQGVDFYSAAGNRLGLGFEYAARFLTGNDIPVFGECSQREKEKFRDIYESIYTHYAYGKNISMPFSRQIIENQTRKKSSIGVLTAFRAGQTDKPLKNSSFLQATATAKLPSGTGALKEAKSIPSKDCVFVKAGESIQTAIDRNPNKEIVLLQGIHLLDESLKIPSGTTLSGQGKNSVLMLKSGVQGLTIENKTIELKDLTIRDLLIECAVTLAPYFDPNEERWHRASKGAPSRGGILFSGDFENQIQNIHIENVTIQNGTLNGLSVRGGNNIRIIACDLNNNGSNVVPGAGFHHNLHLSHVSDVWVENCRLDDSLYGSGLELSFGKNIVIAGNELARNRLAGIRCLESENVSVEKNLSEGNDGEDVAPAQSSNHPMHPEQQIAFVKQQIQSQNEPYYAAYLQLIHAADSVLPLPAHALADFAVPGFYDKPEEHRANSLAIQQDAFGAYCSALAYRLSGDERYGQKALNFLNVWASTNQKYSGHDGVLVMTYSGAGFLLAAELTSDSKLWKPSDKQQFRHWVQTVYQKAANEIRTTPHVNNWADWGRFGSLLSASFLNDKAEIAENIRLIKSGLSNKIAPDGSMPEETRRGNNGIWYTYFSLAPMTAACWLAYNLTGENLFIYEQNGVSMRQAIDYLAYYNEHPDEWTWHSAPNTGANDIWPENLLEAMSGIYSGLSYGEQAAKKRPIMYSKHHFAWVFPTLMPTKFSDVYASQRAGWFQKAEANTPQLIVTEKHPVELVKIQPDENAFQQWKVMPEAPMDSLYRTSFKKRSSVTLDFGEHLTGYFSFQIKILKGTPDAPLRFRCTFGETPAELAVPFDPFNSGMSRAWLQDEIVTVMDVPSEVKIPRRVAFRYVKIELLASSSWYDFTLSDVKCQAQTCAVAQPEALPETMPAIFRTIDRIGLNTLKECMQTVYEDGPKRDQRLWLGDLYLESLANNCSFRQHDLTRRCLYLLAAASDPNGYLLATVFEKPAPHPQAGQFFLDYALLFNVALKNYYEATGDRETTCDLWMVAKQQLAVIDEFLDPDGLINYERAAQKWTIFFDWNDELRKEIALQGIVIYALEQTCQLAQQLGKADEIKSYLPVIKKMRLAAKRAWYDSKSGLFIYPAHRQISYTSQIWMVLGGVALGKEAQKILQNVSKHPDACRFGTPYAYHYYIQALIDCGLHAEARAAVDSYWGGMARKGADTFWEIYDPGNEFLSPYRFYPMNSYCHAWSCTPVYFIRRYPGVFQKMGY